MTTQPSNASQITEDTVLGGLADNMDFVPTQGVHY